VASKTDTLPPPCHLFNRWLSSGQDCDNLSQFHLCFHHSRVDSGSGGILIVSSGDSVVYINLCWVSFYLLGAYEKTNNRYFTRLFNFDCMEFLWVPLENLTRFSRPYYISDEIDARHQATGIHPPMTGYRILVTVVVASGGMTKSALLYGQRPTEATTVECIFGVGIVTGWVNLQY